MPRIPALRTIPLAALLLGPLPALAETGPEPVANLLASIRVLKLECGVKPVPARLQAAVAGTGQRLEWFLPGGRHFGMIQAQLAEMRPPARADRDAFCQRLAERVRTSPLNAPQPAASATRFASTGESGLVDLNRASREELNRLGAGMIGRTIIYGRPYGSPEDLVDRRLLNARDFARIRDRVTVR
jgi:DNA uptake protein ComE-like DNA-binding protein